MPHYASRLPHRPREADNISMKVCLVQPRLRYHLSAPRLSPRGSAMIGALVVVVIILVIIIVGPFGYDSDGDNKDSRPRVFRELNRAQVAACAANRNALFTDMTIQAMGDERVSPARSLVLSRKLSGTRCSGGGLYLMDEKGTIYCTEHNPPPLALLVDLVRVPEPDPYLLTHPPDPNPLIQGDERKEKRTAKANSEVAASKAP
jgi:hypothetical protein